MVDDPSRSNIPIENKITTSSILGRYEFMYKSFSLSTIIQLTSPNNNLIHQKIFSFFSNVKLDLPNFKINIPDIIKAYLSSFERFPETK